MGKSWEQFKHLDEAEYAHQIAALNPEQLTELHARIKRKLISASIGTGFGIASVPLSGGFSLIPSGIQARRTNVNHRRLKIIERRMAEIQADKYHARTRDFAIPTAVSILSMGVTSGAESLLGTEGFLVHGSQFVAENAAGAAHLANGAASEVVMTAGHHFIDMNLVQAGSTAAEMIQEPAYTKVAEETNEKLSAKAATPVFSHALPSVPSVYFAQASNHKVPSVPSSYFSQPWDGQAPSVPSPQLTPPSIAVESSIPSPQLAPATPYVSALESPQTPLPLKAPVPNRPSNWRNNLAPTWVPTPNTTLERPLPPPPRPASALNLPDSELMVPTFPPPPYTSSSGFSALLPPSRPASALGLPIKCPPVQENDTVDFKIPLDHASIDNKGMLRPTMAQTQWASAY